MCASWPCDTRWRTSLSFGITTVHAAVASSEGHGLEGRSKMVRYQGEGRRQEKRVSVGGGEQVL